jgi:predicted PurR-regulated permease PerM
MLGAGTFISALLRVVTTVAILAAVYFFIVKPILHTTETVTRRINVSQSAALKSANRAIRQANVESQRAQNRALRQARITIRKVTTHTSSNAKAPLAIVHCIQRANGDVAKIEACNH